MLERVLDHIDRCHNYGEIAAGEVDRLERLADDLAAGRPVEVPGWYVGRTREPLVVLPAETG